MVHSFEVLPYHGAVQNFGYAYKYQIPSTAASDSSGKIKVDLNKI